MLFPLTSSTWPWYVAGFATSCDHGSHCCSVISSSRDRGGFRIQDSGSQRRVEVFRGNFALPYLLQAVTVWMGSQALAETYLHGGNFRQLQKSCCYICSLSHKTCSLVLCSPQSLPIKSFWSLLKSFCGRKATHQLCKQQCNLLGHPPCPGKAGQ